MTDTPPVDPHETLYITDAELIRRMGVPERIARQAIREMDKRGTGFPAKQKLWGDRRYWPAVKRRLDTQNGLNMEPPQLRRVS
jgi:hypothetical protein